MGEVDGLVLPELPDGPPEAKVVVVVELVVKLQNANAHPFP